ncbi:MAG: PEP-utilizing enzyme [Patescibacteria group bacterium]
MKRYAKLWSRDYSVHYNETLLQILVSQAAGFNLPFAFFTFYQGLSVAVTEEKIKERLYWSLARKYLADQKKFRVFKKEFNNSCQNYLQTAKKYRNLDFSASSNQQLVKILQDYYKPWLVFAKYVYWAFVLGEHQAEIVNNFIAKQAASLSGLEKINDYLSTVNQPVKKASIFIFEQEIVKYKKRGQAIPIDRLYRKYQWLPYNDLNAKPWTKNDFRNYVKQFKPVDSEKISFLKLKNDLKINNQQTKSIKINQELVYLRDYRDEIRRKGVYIFHFIFEKISRRLKIKYQDLILFSTPEIIEFLQGKPISKEEIQRRKQQGILILQEGRLAFLTGRKARYYLNLIKESRKVSREIKGITACVGQAKGRVRIVKFDRDIIKTKKGDIMVAITTHPDYLPKMRICKAIVTDEGGITCHAAIVSRELGIPCVVGTKIATKVLKDGDLIEVDANKGIIIKLR